MPAAKEIMSPTPFEIWRETPVLFDDHVAASQTRVINDSARNGIRYAYAVSVEGFWFFIALANARQELDFWRIYLNWHETATGDHSFTAAPASQLPPSCGTPNTPMCPPPDELQAARDRLRDNIAGVGADETMLRAAEAGINQMLLSALRAAFALSTLQASLQQETPPTQP